MNDKPLELKHYYAIIGFLSPIMIECIDNLQNTNQYRHELKFHLNKSLGILEDINKKFFDHFILSEKKKNTNPNPDEPQSQDIYMAVYKSYEELMKILTTTEPNDLPALVDILHTILNKVDLKQHKFSIDALER